jgi:hypothetical protein
MQLISTFDANAPGGLGATVQNPCCYPGVTDAAHVPRVTDVNDLTVPLAYLTAQLVGGLPSGHFPQTPNPAGEAITWGVDQSLKTPYAYAIDFSIGRELSKGFSLQRADFSGANLSSAYLGGAVFFQANLRRTNLRGADLGGAVFIDTDMRASNIEGCAVYGVSARDVKLDGAVQRNLIITPAEQPTIEVDNLEIAQFIYLILHDHKVRQVIDSIKFKVVLIMGRFTPERKAVLEAIRQELRKRGWLPVLFDFEGPRTQTTEETISTLGHMARFVIADLTDAKSVLQEFRSIVPNSPSVVVQPLLLATDKEPGMFDFFRKFPWVLEPVRYRNQKALIAGFRAKVIAPVEARIRALAAGS